jgi:CRISPR/Cas system-associated endonuclease Cas1
VRRLLIAQTQIRLIVEGFDRTIGIMHEKKALRGINPGFALDHMEPMRLVVDRAVPKQSSSVGCQ